VYHAATALQVSLGCTFFAHLAGRWRTVFVRIPGMVFRYFPLAMGKGLKTLIFPELASFLLRPW